MEEWHQKLHNNTSPDDVVICEALIAYIRAGLDIQAYWDTLHVSALVCSTPSLAICCQGLVHGLIVCWHLRQACCLPELCLSNLQGAAPSSLIKLMSTQRTVMQLDSYCVVRCLPGCQH